jgi:hypothetical protein
MASHAPVQRLFQPALRSVTTAKLVNDERQNSTLADPPIESIWLSEASDKNGAHASPCEDAHHA